MTEANSNSDIASSIKQRLWLIFTEMREQPELANYFPPDQLSFAETMEEIREFIEYAGEYGCAYEVIVATLEQVPFRLSGKAAVSLLEVGLLFGYKTDRPEDKQYDRRRADE